MFSSWHGVTVIWFERLGLLIIAVLVLFLLRLNGRIDLDMALPRLLRLVSTVEGVFTSSD